MVIAFSVSLTETRGESTVDTTLSRTARIGNKFGWRFEQFAAVARLPFNEVKYSSGFDQSSCAVQRDRLFTASANFASEFLPIGSITHLSQQTTTFYCRRWEHSRTEQPRSWCKTAFCSREMQILTQSGCRDTWVESFPANSCVNDLFFFFIWEYRHSRLSSSCDATRCMTTVLHLDSPWTNARMIVYMIINHQKIF